MGREVSPGGMTQCDIQKFLSLPLSLLLLFFSPMPPSLTINAKRGPIIPSATRLRGDIFPEMDLDPEDLEVHSKPALPTLMLGVCAMSICCWFARCAFSLLLLPLPLKKSEWEARIFPKLPFLETARLDISFEFVWYTT